ncbi:MAG: monofunctional biosynthetic peptidoglycan transglycosylase [Methylobacteriaceae bacterium]|nr:monofunctional biosynthetic peptidoglycan transglycosylase [Methylobacteriaceae bacterium]
MLRTALRWALRLLIAAALLEAALLVAWRFAPPVSTLMLARWATLRSVEREWRPLSQIAPALAAAVVASEDARFCRHGGVDWTELRAVVEEGLEDGPTRGASTITMQTVKNVLLWPSRSFLRKGLEIPLALVADPLWSKRRTMEIYLNVAEWGEGVFGAEAAARRHFGKSAAQLSVREAALLAAALPNPIERVAGRPTARHRARAAVIERRMRAGGGLDCLRAP